MYKRSAKNLNIYTYKFEMGSFINMELFHNYDIRITELIEDEMPQIALDVPAFFLVRSDESDEKVWQYMDYIQKQKLDMIVFMFCKEPTTEFMQEAIDHHLDELVTGNVWEKKKEISQKITHSLEKIETMSKIRKNLMKLEVIHFSKRQKVMEEILTSALKSPDLMEKMLPEVNERYDVNIGERNFLVLVISCNRRELLSESAEFVRRVTLLVLNNMKMSREIICNRRDPYGLIVVMNLPEDYSDLTLHYDLTLLYLAIKALEAEYGAFDLSFGVGPVVERIHGIARSLTEASMAQEFRMFSDKRILYAKEIKDVNRNWNQYMSAAKVSELSRFVAMANTEAVKDWFSEFRENVEPKLKEYPPAFARICWECYNYCIEMEIPDRAMFPEKSFFSLQHIFDGPERIRRLESILLDVCRLIKNGGATGQDIASRAISYMKENYDKPLNLETIAEECGVSPSYFSRKFKAETGEKYIDALTDIRIQEAERLLEETDESILDIMEKVGYLDDKHFRRVFTKRTGMTPTEYRKKIKHF